MWVCVQSKFNMQSRTAQASEKQMLSPHSQWHLLTAVVKPNLMGGVSVYFWMPTAVVCGPGGEGNAAEEVSNFFNSFIGDHVTPEIHHDLMKSSVVTHLF